MTKWAARDMDCGL